MKFELSDDAVLRLGSVVNLAYGAHHLGAPKHAQDMHLEKTAPRSDVMTQWFGLGLGSLAAAGLSVSAAEGCTQAKKNLLKAQGTGFLVCAAQHLQNAHENTERSEMAYTQAAIGAVVGGLSLWRGFADEDKDEVEVKKTK